MLYDTHAHLDFFPENEIDLIVKNALANDVGLVNTICVEIDKFDQIIKIANKYDNVFCSVGQHPCYYQKRSSFYDDILIICHNNKKVVGIGETGLDFYKTHDNEMIKWQKNTFISHIEASIELGLPLIVHTRNAGNETIDILKSFNGLAKGLIHCFTESEDFMKKALDLGFYISFSGIVTFKNALDLQKIAKAVPDDRILIETDAPYLAPIPYRGKQNEPAFVTYVAQFVAELKGTSFDKIAEITTQNAKKTFAVD
jgi:TatD DNase family protein